MMSFAFSVPWWVIALVAAGLGGVAWWTYARAAVTPRRRAALTTLRALTLILLFLILLRPIVLLPQPPADTVVPILVDVSRSMRIADVNGQSRRDAAAALVKDRLLPMLQGQFKTEVLAFGEGLAASAPDRLTADGPLSDIEGALAAVRDRYRDRRLSGVVLLSDGAETAPPADAVRAQQGPPVFTVGLGAASVSRDREVLGVSVGEATLSDSVVELSATFVSHGYGDTPFDVRVLENGRPIHVRKLSGRAGTPVTERFRVSPRQDAATVYAVEIAPDASEITGDNNRFSVLVSPPRRARRLLLVEGAPGFEHSFLKRAWLDDRGLEVDSVVRKGRNDLEEETYYVQAAKARAAALADGYPSSREVLFSYDAIVLANVDADLLTREQLALTADFVAERGGGLLMLGARSLAPTGLASTPLGELMPLDVSDRLGRAAASVASRRDQNKLVLTTEGERHPIMQLGTSADEARKRWTLMPPLGASMVLGATRPGGAVLATVGGGAGTAAGQGGLPLVAVQRYGRGRSMVFAGEASWRWRMMVPSANHTYETFWKQAGRWLATAAPEPVSLHVPPSLDERALAPIDVEVRDREYRLVPDADVTIRITNPSGATRELTASLDDRRAGRFTSTMEAPQRGLYRVDVDARRAGELLGSAREWVLAGGADREMADPRMNDDVLRRIASETGGAMLTAASLGELPERLTAAASQVVAGARRERDLWHSPFVFLLIVTLLGAEWALRRWWGLR